MHKGCCARTLPACWVVPALLVSLLVGCGGGKAAVPTGMVTGQVTHHGGKPLSNATIYFASPQLGVEVSADLGPDGKFQFKQPVKSGDYQVQVTPPPSPPATPPSQRKDNADIPKKSRAYPTSKLTATVKAGNNEFNFDLKE